ncbi:hypothetical protein ILUMI_13126 [Ignelater luminosus]|uniref:Uncharacterized protein n=1 Tax=Ignelater luminosus TaxID=2038154 RepID=A0A8K0GBQ5_IGNLU|nr:hypothetical protein ILUMI_13126 [Ignelater luminosus]
MSNQSGLIFILCNSLDDATVSEEITTTACLGIYIPDLHGNTQQEDCDHVFDDLNTEWTHITMPFIEGTAKNLISALTWLCYCYLLGVSDFRENNTDGQQKKTATVLFPSSALDALILPCDERLLDEQLSSSNIKIIASESPIALESSEQLDHGLSYSEEIEEAEMDNEAIKNDEYTLNEADENNDHPAIENKEDDDYIPLETNASSDDNSSSTGNDEEAKIDDKTTLKKKQSSGVVESDLRGQHQPANKLSENTRNKIREHIAKFPVNDSHYSRGKTKRQYLGNNLNIARMYQLFKEECQNERMGNDDISKQWLYAHIFNTEFNLGFKAPATDTCNMCDEYQILFKGASNVNQQTFVQEKYEKHLAEAQQRYQTKKADKETAKQNDY